MRIGLTAKRTYLYMTIRAHGQERLYATGIPAQDQLAHSEHLETLVSDTRRYYNQHPYLLPHEVREYIRYRYGRQKKSVHLLQDVISSDREKKKSENSRSHYRYLLQHLSACHPQVSLHQAYSQDWVDKFIAYLLTRMKPVSAESYLKSLMAVFNGQVRKGTLLKQDIVIRLKIEDKPVIALYRSELQALREVKLKRSQALYRDKFLLGYHIGQRYSSFNGIRHQDVQYTGQGILLYIYASKNDKVLTVPLPKQGEAERILQAYRQADPVYIMPWRHRGMMNRSLKTMARRAGLGRMIETTVFAEGRTVRVRKPLWQLISSHCMRRTHTTESLRQGMNVYQVMENTGRKNIASMKVYIDFANIEERRQSLSLLE